VNLEWEAWLGGNSLAELLAHLRAGLSVERIIQERMMASNRLCHAHVHCKAFGVSNFSFVV
jgi:hypothetical protein